MSVPNQDFEVIEGAPHTLSVPITWNGMPYEIPVPSLIEWWASPSQFDAAASVPIKKSTALGDVTFVTNGGQSTVVIYLQGSDTVGRGQKKLFHQTRMTIVSSGVIVPLFSGTMSVIKRLVA
jgi:hypothetical protein